MTPKLTAPILFSTVWSAIPAIKPIDPTVTNTKTPSQKDFESEDGGNGGSDDAGYINITRITIPFHSDDPYCAIPPTPASIFASLDLHQLLSTLARLHRFPCTHASNSSVPALQQNVVPKPDASKLAAKALQQNVVPKPDASKLAAKVYYVTGAVVNLLCGDRDNMKESETLNLVASSSWTYDQHFEYALKKADSFYNMLQNLNFGIDSFNLRIYGVFTPVSISWVLYGARYGVFTEADERLLSD
ncbi:hypothetical protein LXL04_027403 [Taraxacum kok-saghyz]